MKIYRCDFLLDKILECRSEVIEQIIATKEEKYEYFEIPKKGGITKSVISEVFK